jgi:putative ABC transport system substrate-binding protein
MSIKRREFLTLIAGSAAFPVAASAQQLARQQRMAMFHPAIPPALLTETGGGSAWRAFFGELRRLGYIEGQNLLIERYWADGRHDRYAEVAREIVSRNPDLIVTGTNPVVTVFKAATSTIPVVAFMLDPLQTGLVANLNRPGGNLTGITLDAGIEIWGEAARDIERSHSFDDEGDISGDARRMGRVFRASLAGRRRAIGNFAGLYLSARGETRGD